MQIIKLIGLTAALLPLSAVAGPMGPADVVSVERAIFKRGNDICDRTAAIGDTCNHGPGEDEPHICAHRGNAREVLHCVKGKWKLNNKCGAGTHCTCTDSNDITCAT
ncbi:hypothetical protein F5Y15DRAFT_395047 [Xylariaceae sp. FL0016]|nr:hypothetical protein F5Y15DRAFT_395047 [Xylariaceae sp. FL0016]